MKVNALNPQDVVNLLIDDYDYIAMDKDKVWYTYMGYPTFDKVVRTWNGDEVCPIKLNINFNGNPEDSLFVKESQFEDGDLVLVPIGNIWNPRRYAGKGAVYGSTTENGHEGVSNYDIIIKFDKILMGTRVKNNE